MFEETIIVKIRLIPQKAYPHSKNNQEKQKYFQANIKNRVKKF